MTIARDIAKAIGASVAAGNISSDGGVAAGAGLTIYETIDDLPLIGVDSGSMAFVNSLDRMYVHNGTGWYSNTIRNNTPHWITEPDANIYIQDSATPLITIASAADSEELPITYSGFASDSAQYIANISQDSSVFTFTPVSQDSLENNAYLGNLDDSAEASFTYTFRASDGVNILTKQSNIVYSFRQWLLGYGSNALYSHSDISGFTWTMGIHNNAHNASDLFDDGAGSQFHGSSGSTGHIQFQFPVARKVTKYHVYERKADNNSSSINDQMRVTGYTLRGSNDGSSWTVLHTADEGTDYTRAPKPNYGSNNSGDNLYSTLNADGTPTIGTEFTISSPDYYTYYRLNWDTVVHYGIMGAWALYGS